MKFKWKALAGVAAAMALVVAPLTVAGASAHTGDLHATAECTETGNYVVTYKLEITNAGGKTGTTMWHIGDAAWDNSPEVGDMELGPKTSNGNETITLGTGELPGTTKGNGPWVYAYTVWGEGHDAVKRWSDTRIEGLKGDCKPTIPEQPAPKTGDSEACSGPAERTKTFTETPYVWDAATSAWVLGEPKVVKTVKSYDIKCAIEVTPTPPTWVDECGPGNGHWEYPANPIGYSYNAWSLGKWRNVTILPSPFDGYYLKPFTKLTYTNKDSKVPCAEGEQPTPVPAQFNAEPLAADCGIEGRLPADVVAGDYERVTVEITTGEGPNTRVITVTPKEGFYLEDLGEAWTENEDGSATRVITLAAAIPADAEECQLIPGDIASECVGSVPYLGYAVALPEGFEADSDTPVTITFVHPTDPTQNYVVENQPLEGTLLWPGASAGTPQQWPGWVRNADGTYSETEGNYAWTRTGITVQFDVNPTYSTVVEYPEESALCANPASAPANSVAALPATGGTDMTPWGIGAAVMLLAGAALIVTRRRLVRR